MTSPLESFTIGHTIVLSRGLTDVLPDEASLAMILADELGHIVLGHQLIDTKYSFSDRMLIDDTQILNGFRFRNDPAENAEADKRAMELLKNSPYADALAKRIRGTSCLIFAAPLPVGPLLTIPPASDKKPYVPYNVCASIQRAKTGGIATFDDGSTVITPSLYNLLLYLIVTVRTFNMNSQLS
jgi:hypothetical protein